LTSITSVIVALITAGFIRRKDDKAKAEKSKKQLIDQIQKDELIHATLREIRRKYNSDRVFITQFHNGGTFYTNSPMQKASVTYERCSDGLKRIADQFQNYLVSNLSWYASKVLKNQAFFYDVDEVVDDIIMKSVFKNYSTWAHAAVPIFDSNKNPIAVLAMDWVISELPVEYVDDEDFNDEFTEEFTKDGNSLKTYLM
jgi:endonuclease IV